VVIHNINASPFSYLQDEVMADLASIVSKVSKTEKGVYVQASTLGSLEALLSFLQVSHVKSIFICFDRFLLTPRIHSPQFSHFLFAFLYMCVCVPTQSVNIPVAGVGIGPIHKKDVMKAGVMLERQKEYGTC
jgi:translation initiation factor 5B